MPKRSAASKEGGSAELAKLLLGDKTRVSALPKVSLDLLLQRSHEELSRAARRLGLTGVSRLRKKDSAAACARRSGSSRPPGGRRPPGSARSPSRKRAPARSSTWGARSGSRRRPATSRGATARTASRPWSWTPGACTRTGAATRRSRRRAPRSGRAAGTRGSNLRVYDVSGRIFDGRTRHSYFDVKVDRDTRQWFFEIGKPTSSHCVEIGLKSYEGYFAKIVRSVESTSRARRRRAGGGRVAERFHDITGEIGAPTPGAPPPTAPPRPRHPAPRRPARPPGAWAEASTGW